MAHTRVRVAGGTGGYHIGVETTDAVAHGVPHTGTCRTHVHNAKGRSRVDSDAIRVYDVWHVDSSDAM